MACELSPWQVISFLPLPPSRSARARTHTHTPLPPQKPSQPRDWDYDELHFFLGQPLGAAAPANVLDPHPAPIPPAINLTSAWSLYVRSPATSNASWALDPAVRPTAQAPPSARVDVQNTAASSDGIDLSQLVAFESGGYALSFWARASRNATSARLNARKNGGDWHNVGLDYPLLLSTEWALYNATFAVQSDGSPARLSWFLGLAGSSTSIWINSPALSGTRIPLPVLQREFECGTVVLNGDAAARTVLLNASAGLQRLQGQQAPRVQLFFDDNSSAFTALSGAWAWASFDSGYNGATTPSQEEVRPANGFYHHWRVGAHTAPAGASAAFALAVPPGEYCVSLWWPAAVPARAAWARAMRVTLSPSGFQTTLDLSAQGGDEFLLLSCGLQLQPTSTLTLECPEGGGLCVADAALVESAARYNDGSAAESVDLQPMDGIVLQRTLGAPPHCASAGAGGGGAGQ